MLKYQNFSFYALGVIFGHFYCVTIPERIICTRNNVITTTAIPYEVRKLPVTTDGCYLKGITALPPGPPRVNVTSQRNKLRLEIKSPHDASVKALKGFLVKIFVSGEPFNLDPECCYFINFTKIYTSTDELKEIMNAAFSIHCLYTGTEPSEVTILTSSYPESISTTRVRKVITVPGELITRVNTEYSPLASQRPRQESTIQTDTENSDVATRYVVAFILSLVVSVTVTVSVVIVVKWRRKRRERFDFHSDD